MTLHSRLFGTFAAFLASIALAGPSLAGPLRLVRSDATGVTLQLEVPGYDLEPAAEARSLLHAVLGGADRTPGRPALPFASVTLALPPGARAVVRVLGTSAEESKDVRLAPNGRPALKGDPGSADQIPVIEPVDPIRDGPWPAQAADASTPYVLRRQRLVAVHVHPFRYDESLGRLTVHRSMTVRVDFVGGRVTDGVSSPDAHWDPVLETAVLNFRDSRAWRARAQPLRSGRSSLFDDAAGRRTGALGAARVTGFDETHTEVRLLTDTSGVYAFRFEDLAASGFPAGVPVGQVSVHRHEFIEHADPAYATIELPIELDDANANGVFDAGDRILAFVQSWAQRSRVNFWQRQWGEGDVLYATYITDRPALRMASRPGWRNLSGPPVLFSYPFLQKFEQNVQYTRFPPDTNTDQFHWSDVLFYSRRDSFPFETDDLDTTKQVQFVVNWGGSQNSNHAVWADVRNFRGATTSIADSARWFGYQDFRATATLHGSALTEGPTNVFKTWGRSGANLLSYASLDWFQLTYWRYYRAIGGVLSCTNGNAAGAYEVQASGFVAGGLRAYDVTDSLNPVRLDVDPSHITFDGAEYTLAFQDSSGGEKRSYVVYDTPKVLAPERITAVIRRNLAGATSPNYLIVVPEAWLDAANTLADMRRAQGYKVLVAPLEAVDDEFNGGRRSPYALRRFFEYAFNAWNSEFAILLGDASEDPLNYDGLSGTDYVPTYKLFGPVFSGDAREIVPCDNWLVSFETPSLPSIFLGRIPADSHDDLTAVVGKLVKYENLTPDQTWRKDVLLLADDKYSTTTFDGFGGSTTQYCEKTYELVFKALSDSCRSIIIDHAGLRDMNVEVFDVTYYLRNEPYTLDFQGDTCRVSWTDTQRRSHATVTPLIFQRLNEGRMWWNYQGHANQYVLAHEDLYVNRGVNDDKELFTNVDKPFLFTAFSCHPNGFAAWHENKDNIGPSLGEDMVMLPNRGSIASWASVGFEILPANDGSPHLNTRFANHLFANPALDPGVGEHGARVVLGEAVALALEDTYSEEAGNVYEQLVGYTYALLGDPATRISIGSPEVLVTANGVPVTNGEPVRLASSGDTLRIEADVVSNVELKTLTLELQDGTGTHLIPAAAYTVTPAFPDTVQGGRRYHLSYQAGLSAGSYRYVIRTTDRNGLPTAFAIVFELGTVLRSENVAIRSGDAVRSDANLSLELLSPSPIDPVTDIQLLLNGVPLTFTAQPFQQDTTRREWLLAWTHAPYAAGDYDLKVSLGANLISEYHFVVSDHARLQNLMAFPNPFDDDLGTRFSFEFTGSQPFDLLVRVFTIAGRLIYEHSERGLEPGYHQIPWDGRDAEGQKIANGIYFYKLMAKSGSGNVVEQGRLVKLRKPHHAIEPDASSTP